MVKETRFLRRTEHLYYTAQMLFWLLVPLTAALGVLFMQARGRDLAEIGLLLGAYSLSVVIFEFPSGVLADRYGRKRVALAAYTLLLASSLVFLFPFSFPAFLLFSVLNGAGRAFTSGALSAWFIDRLQEADPVVDVQPLLARAAALELLALTAGTLLGGALPTMFSALPADGTTVLTPLTVPAVAGGQAGAHGGRRGRCAGGASGSRRNPAGSRAAGPPSVLERSRRPLHEPELPGAAAPPARNCRDRLRAGRG